MQRIKKGGNRVLRIYGKQLATILVCVALCGVIAWAQKTDDESEKGVTLGDLGVTEAQKVQLATLWDLKRQKGIQAINDLKTLNRLAKDSLVEERVIQENLDEFRAKRKEVQAEIDEIEETLIQTLPTQAQLYLTLMGVLDNGIPRRIKRAQTDKQTEKTSKPEPTQ